MRPYICSSESHEQDSHFQSWPDQHLPAAHTVYRKSVLKKGGDAGY